jgi:biopolymer transport protein ExbD
MRRKQDNSAPPELNLAPIMNMVVILIPLLLLSVVFLSVGVINASSPAEIVTGKPTHDTEPPLNLTVAIAHNGFIVSTKNGLSKPVSGCPADGPTVCLRHDANLPEEFAAAQTALESGDTGASEAALDRATAAYDWNQLYTLLAQIKRDNLDETMVKITADPDVPYTLVVRTMDLARFELEQTSYASNREMWTAGKKRPLFPDPVLAIAR